MWLSLDFFFPMQTRCFQAFSDPIRKSRLLLSCITILSMFCSLRDLEFLTVFWYLTVGLSFLSAIIKTNPLNLYCLWQVKKPGPRRQGSDEMENAL